MSQETDYATPRGRSRAAARLRASENFLMPEKEDAKALDFEAFFRSFCTLPRFLQPPETLLPSADKSQVRRAGTVDMRMPEKALTDLL